MLPAYAGMIRERHQEIPNGRGAPRVCGDDPLLIVSDLPPLRVLPAYAGMILPPKLRTSFLTGAPRVCGDDPIKENLQ